MLPLDYFDGIKFDKTTFSIFFIPRMLAEREREKEKEINVLSIASANISTLSTLKQHGIYRVPFPVFTLDDCCQHLKHLKEGMSLMNRWPRDGIFLPSMSIGL